MKKGLLIIATALLTLGIASCGNENKPSSSAPNSSNVEDIHVTAVSILNKDQATLKVGETLTLQVQVLPTNATNQLVNYASSDTDVAYVSFDGVVHAKKGGTCTISAKSDDGAIEDTMTLTVLESSISDFSVAFGSEVETIVSNKNLYYKLILGMEYPLEVHFTSSDNKSEELEATFNLDGYCSFDAKTNTLKALKKVDALIVTFKVKGTNLKKEFYLKVVNPGEKDVSEVLNLLSSSKEKESKKTVNSYEENLEYNTLDVNENRTHIVQNSTLKIYKKTLDRYMIGDTSSTREYTAYGSEKTTTSHTDTQRFKGLSEDGYYYEYEVDAKGNHYVFPSKKAIVDSVSDSSNQITREAAIKKATTYSMNSNDGLSAIAMFHFSYLYENSLGFGSLPLYFGGNASSHTTIKEENHQIIADTYFIESKPTSVTKGEAFFNHGVYSFNDEGILTSIQVTAMVYDNTGFDFNTETLKEDAKAIEFYKTEYIQNFGELYTQEENPIDPQNLYFTDYTPVLLNKDGNKVSEYEVGQTYYIAYENQQPNIANSYIDALIIDESSQPDVASIGNQGLSITIEKSGVSVLKIYSSKNRVAKELIVNVGVTLPTSIDISANGTVTSSLEVDVDSSTNISYAVLPSAASQEVTATLEGVGTLTPGSNNNYTYTSQEAGTATITFTSKVDGRVKGTLTIKVNEKAAPSTLTDILLANTYKCDNKQLNEASEVYSHALTFTSSTKADFMVEPTYPTDTILHISCDIVIDETNRTVTFTSFDLPSSFDEDEYASYYLPFIKLNEAYSISEDGLQINLRLYALDNGDMLDFATWEDEVALYLFEAK